jgi:hypothetical protein
VTRPGAAHETLLDVLRRPSRYKKALVAAVVAALGVLTVPMLAGHSPSGQTLWIALGTVLVTFVATFQTTNAPPPVEQPVESPFAPPPLIQRKPPPVPPELRHPRPRPGPYGDPTVVNPGDGAGTP